MSKERQYTPKTLDKAVRNYFKSISRLVNLTERKPTGEKDKMGHEIYEEVQVINALGKQVQVLEYIIPPSVGDLAVFLGIHRSTWARYCEDEAYCDTTTHARGLMHAYLERESLTRSGKDLKGVLFNLENNYGYRERMEVGTGTIEEFLQGLEEKTGSVGF